MPFCSSDSMAQEVSRGPGTYIHPNSPHHTLSAFMGYNCLLTSGMMRRKTSGLEGYGGKPSPWLNLEDHAMQMLQFQLMVSSEDECLGVVGSD